MKNEQFITYEGTITNIGEIENINYTGKDGVPGSFAKKVLTVNCVLGEGQWVKNMLIPFNANGKSIPKLEGFTKGEDVLVTFMIASKGKFVNLNLVKLERAAGNQTAPQQGGFESQDDDLPF